VVAPSTGSVVLEPFPFSDLSQSKLRPAVLHHIPPIRYPRSGKEKTEAAELLQIYRPEYFISGHSHQFPYFPSSRWAQIVNGVNVLVPGQLLTAPIPNHFVFNTESGEASWETSSQE
jgi:hypothetical protein